VQLIVVDRPDEHGCVVLARLEPRDRAPSGMLPPLRRRGAKGQRRVTAGAARFMAFTLVKAVEREGVIVQFKMLRSIFLFKHYMIVFSSALPP